VALGAEDDTEADVSVLLAPVKACKGRLRKRRSRLGVFASVVSPLILVVLRTNKGCYLRPTVT
jgi:hypothetical protein